MGFSGIGPGSLLVILAIVLIIFGTKRLKGMGKDLGGAVKGFKSAISDESSEEKDITESDQADASFSESAEQDADKK